MFAAKPQMDYSEQSYTIVNPLQTVFWFPVVRLKLNSNFKEVRSKFSVLFLSTNQQNCQGSLAKLDWNHNFEDLWSLPGRSNKRSDFKKWSTLTLINQMQQSIQITNNIIRIVDNYTWFTIETTDVDRSTNVLNYSSIIWAQYV